MPPIRRGLNSTGMFACKHVGFIPRGARQAIQSMRAASKSGLGAEYTKAA